MNDRFKFRFWNHVQNKMTFGDGFIFVYPQIYINDELNTLNVYQKDTIEIMQCTGLKDKNGKLVYEGDIVKAYYINSDTNKQEFDLMKVVYNEKVCAFGLQGLNTNGFSDFVSYEWEPEEYEVIGNIYENEDLLK